MEKCCVPFGDADHSSMNRQAGTRSSFFYESPRAGNYTVAPREALERYRAEAELVVFFLYERQLSTFPKTLCWDLLPFFFLLYLLMNHLFLPFFFLLYCWDLLHFFFRLYLLMSRLFLPVFFLLYCWDLLPSSPFFIVGIFFLPSFFFIY